ncbi:MAG TPA: GerMN domain-containing protein [Fimbriimonadaceae bacterium]|nr:GerMN domain-containing protein [Fimbriimonadaceae bacterium]
MCGAAVGVGAIAEYVAHTPSLKQASTAGDEPAAGALTKPRAPAPTETPKAQTTVLVFVPTMGVDGITFAKQTAEVTSDDDPKVVAVNAFLKAAQIAPADAAAESVTVQDGLATVVFNPAFDQTYGSFDEKKMIDGLKAALGQFPEIERFSLFIGVKPMTTLGNADLTDPIPVTRPEAVPVETTKPQ